MKKERIFWMAFYCLFVFLFNPFRINAQPKISSVVDVMAKPVAFAPGIISTYLDEGAISFTPDGKTVYTSQGNFATIIFSETSAGKWETPRVCAFSGKWSDTDPFVSPDGKKIFFISNRPMKDANPEVPQNVMQIWCASLISPNEWSLPVRLDSSVNRNGTGSFAPSVSARGTLYFCARRKEHPGMQGYFCHWLGDHYGTANMLTIPGVSQIQDPSIAPDENYLVFLSGNDLYISFSKEGNWSAAEKLPENINNGDHNASPYVSQDGKLLYYTSSRTSGFYDRTAHPLISYDDLLKENTGIYNTAGNILVVPIHLEKSWIQ